MFDETIPVVVVEEIIIGLNFPLHLTVFPEKDPIKNFGSLYPNASEKGLKHNNKKFSSKTPIFTSKLAFQDPRGNMNSGF